MRQNKKLLTHSGAAGGFFAKKIREQPFYIQKARKKSYYNSKSLAYKKVYVQMDKKVVEEEQNEKH